MVTLRMGKCLRQLMRWKEVIVVLTICTLVLIYRAIFPSPIAYHAQKFRLVDARGTLGPGWDAEAEGGNNDTEDYRPQPKASLVFRYLINEPLLCMAGVDIINMIPVAPGNMETRSVIREAWGATVHAISTTMRTVFVLGTSTSGAINQRLLEESSQYHDLIQLSFIDSYTNLPLKIMAMLHWKNNYCPEARWFLFSKPDVFINPFALKRYLVSHHSNFVCAAKNTYCSTPDCQADRAQERGNHPRDGYNSQCCGDAYVLSSKLSRLAFAASNKSRKHVLEDFSNYQPIYIIPDSGKVSVGSAVQAIFPTKLTKGKILIEKFWHMILAYNNMTLVNVFELQGSM